jgi:hypothetical protein
MSQRVNEPSDIDLDQPHNTDHKEPRGRDRIARRATGYNVELEQ